MGILITLLFAFTGIARVPRSRPKLTSTGTSRFQLLSKTRKQVRRYRKRINQLLQREKAARGNLYDLKWLETKVSRTTAEFIRLQIREQKHKPRGRRFSISEKLFCLALMKNSPKQYRLMKKFFALPSRRTLMRVCIYVM